MATNEWLDSSDSASVWSIWVFYMILNDAWCIKPLFCRCDVHWLMNDAYVWQMLLHRYLTYQPLFYFWHSGCCLARWTTATQLLCDGFDRFPCQHWVDVPMSGEPLACFDMWMYPCLGNHKWLMCGCTRVWGTTDACLVDALSLGNTATFSFDFDDVILPLTMRQVAHVMLPWTTWEECLNVTVFYRYMKTPYSVPHGYVREPFHRQLFCHNSLCFENNNALDRLLTMSFYGVIQSVYSDPSCSTFVSWATSRKACVFAFELHVFDAWRLDSPTMTLWMNRPFSMSSRVESPFRQALESPSSCWVVPHSMCRATNCFYACSFYIWA